MEKENVKFAVLVLVGFLLIITTFLGHIKSNCLMEVEEMQNNLTTLYFDMDYQMQGLLFLNTQLLIGNYTNVIIEGGGESVKIVMPVDVRLRNFTEGYMNMIVDTQGNIKSLEKEIIDKKSRCNTISSFETIFLYTALIFNLFCIFLNENIRIRKKLKKSIKGKKK